MKIEMQETESKGRYVVLDEGQRAGEMTFSRAGPELIIIDHTEVSDAYRGRNLGRDLVARAVEDARVRGWKILPLCPFAKSQFQRQSAWRDVLST